MKSANMNDSSLRRPTDEINGALEKSVMVDESGRECFDGDLGENGC
jgi:hypothetical protein